MASLKCKMCGAMLEITGNSGVAECEYCGTKQTLTKSREEVIQNLFNRANTLRLKSEFDKAQEIYEKIVASDGSDAEAYWGLVLCKYGIEYVEDPKTFKRIPTCHRTQIESVFTDVDYCAAIDHADCEQKSLYQAEAAEIDRLQKDILQIANKEDPFDVFICYKETDESGKRTTDSVIANDIYYQLTQEGFKVFYAAITLEDKLGREYEPYIFAALNSAKVMLVVGSKPEYFNAVWVKNEWSRYLKLMKNDRSRLLIPCFKDMDAYELPEEFSHLQAQDMGKIGFINDVVRGIKKVLASEKPKVEKTETVIVNSGNTNTAPLLQRAFMFLEDKNWASADEYCEKVLDLEPQNALAYLGKLMAELRIPTEDKLVNHNVSLDDRGNYQKAVRFADEGLKKKLTSINASILERINAEELDKIYRRALGLKDSASSENEYKEAVSMFETISGWKDADELARQCADKASIFKQRQTYSSALSFAKQYTESSLRKAVELLREIESWMDASQLIIQYENELAKIIAAKEFSYAKAQHELENGKSFEVAKKLQDAFVAYKTAQKEFSSIVDFKDSKANADWCSQKLEELGPTLTLMVLDSKSPLALANGSHYVYEICEKNSGIKEKVTVDLVKGTTTYEMRLEPGDYSIDLKVYGWATSPDGYSPIHSTSCSIRLAPFEKWKAVSNRPGLISKLQISVEKIN